VAEHRQELVLAPFRGTSLVREHLRAVLGSHQLLMGAGVGDGRRDVLGHEREKSAVLVVQMQSRAEPGDQETVGSRERRARDGNDGRRFDRLGPYRTADVAESPAHIGHEF